MNESEKNYVNQLTIIRDDLNHYIDANLEVMQQAFAACSEEMKSQPVKAKMHFLDALLPTCHTCKRTALSTVLENKEESFSEMLLRMIDEKELKDSDVYKQANIDRRLFSKIRSDEEYIPSKKTAIAFCLALQLELPEAKKLLATAGYALSSSSKFDLIIRYFIENSEYNINFVNIVLEDYGVGTLSR